MKRNTWLAICFFFIGANFLFAAFMNLGYEDTSFGTLVFFGIGGLALILEGLRRIQKKNRPTTDN